MGALKDVIGYEGIYQVSNVGEIFKVFPERLRQNKTHPSSGGYLKAVLTKDGITKHPTVHRLVANAFIPNPEDLPFVNHKDCDKTNNSVSNLEWCTRRKNIEHAVENGLFSSGERHWCCKLTEEQVNSIREDTRTTTVIAKEYSISIGYVSLLKNRKYRN
jgi:hypothetical protein